MGEDEYKKFIKEELAKRGLSTTGTMRVLISRYQAALADADSESDNFEGSFEEIINAPIINETETNQKNNGLPVNEIDTNESDPELFAHLDFDSLFDCEEQLGDSLADEEIPQHPNKVNKSSKQNDPFKVYVGNIPYKCNENDLFEVFGKFGDIVDVVIPRKSGRSRGFAFIFFRFPENGERAIKEMSKQELMGRRIRVQRARKPKKLKKKKKNEETLPDDEERKITAKKKPKKSHGIKKVKNTAAKKKVKKTSAKNKTKKMVPKLLRKESKRIKGTTERRRRSK